MSESDHVSLRLSLTEQCQLRCRYCRPSHAEVLPAAAVVSSQIWARRIRALAMAVRIDKIRLTGGEPLLYPELEEVLRFCTGAGIPDIALTTNGFRLAGMAPRLRDAGLQRINISFDSPDAKVFRAITGAPPERVVEGIDAALAAGLIVKLNAVILRGMNDNQLLDLLLFAADRQIPIRFLEMMPIGPAARDFDALYISGREMMGRLGAGVQLEPLPYEAGETSRNFKAGLPDGRTVVCGFILPTSGPFCKGCRRLRLTADGRMLGCLARPDAREIENAVRAVERGDLLPMRELVRKALLVKSRPQQFQQQRDMVRVGG